MKRIGIVACSSEGAALCYRTISLDGAELLGRPHAHPPVVLDCVCLAEGMEYIDRGDWAGLGELMLEQVKRLHAAGADFVICPDNTIHQALPFIRERSPLPWLHIAEVVADDAQRRGLRHLGVLGTRYLMEGPVYRETLAARGLGMTVPDALTRAEINRIIFDELVNAVFLDKSRATFTEIIDSLRDQGCDGVALSCTEIPLIVRPEDSSLPTLDSTRLLARAALHYALA